MKDKIVYLAGTLLMGVSAWVLTTTLQIEKDIVEVKIKVENAAETLEKTYSESCPYCNHYAHSELQNHPLLAPTIKHSHRHIGDEIVKSND
jgi:hypothetical protein